ncbi:hypothetical protein CYMTET_27990 [Cymbomonas tetramitiformis]|uniref:Uncharacterized protein n=1 Tax=Cymbomonas tetramitiformis TaxID=36881 RepID=A0AAE0FNN4_9CHLO|nr:hypothetical protein CYMTET_27990 [Cymbomonas tetramitiformis]
MALYLRFLTDRAETYSVVKTASRAIFSVHEVALVPRDQNPTKSELCKAVREQAKRNEVWLGGEEPQGSHARGSVGSRKNDQYRDGDVVYVSRGSGKHFCPVDLAETLIEAGQLSGAVNLFQGWDGRKAVRDPQVPLNGRHMDYHVCRREIVRMVAQGTGKTEEEVRQVFGTQSMRSGGATVVARKVSFEDFMRHGHWMTASAATRYIEPSTEERVAVTVAADY